MSGPKRSPSRSGSPEVYFDYERERGPKSKRNFYQYDPLFFDRDRMRWELVNKIWIDYYKAYHDHKTEWEKANPRRRPTEDEERKKFEEQRARQKRAERAELERIEKKKRETARR